MPLPRTRSPEAVARASERQGRHRFRIKVMVSIGADYDGAANRFPGSTHRSNAR